MNLQVAAAPHENIAAGCDLSCLIYMYGEVAPNVVGNMYGSGVGA